MHNKMNLTQQFYHKIAALLICCLCISILSDAAFAQQMLQKAGQRSYAPAEFVLKYESISRSFPRGAAIQAEHARVGEILQQQLRLPIANISAVHEYLVQKMLTNNQSEQEVLEASRAKRNSRRLKQLDLSKINLSRNIIVRLQGKDWDIPSLIKEVEHSKDVFERAGFRLVSISPNWLERTQAIPNDPLYRFQWSHQVTNIEVAWEEEKGSSEVIIAVIDTGIDDLNPDLVENLVPGFDFVRIDRTAYEAWELIDGEDYVGRDDDPLDTDGHGTHVSGIAAAKGFDGFGVAGVCPDCSIMPLRAGAQFNEIDEDSDMMDTLVNSRFRGTDVADAIMYAIDNGADIINMSLGGDSRSGYENVLQFANASGVVLIGAAGNDDVKKPFYPAFFQEVIAVASTSTDDQKSDFSNYGSWIDVSAPGSGILSTFPEGLRGGLNESKLAVNGEDYETTIFTFSGLTQGSGLSGDLIYVGLGRETDLSNSNYQWDLLAGNIAFIMRGEITFKEKVDRVRERGAIGAIIFNHQEGPVFGTLIEAVENQIPVVGLTDVDGQRILSQLSQQNQSAQLSVSLLSNIHAYSSGTSMASPYVAGMAGLLLSKEPSLNPDEVKARIISSVDPIDGVNPDYVGQLGTGRVNLELLFNPVNLPVEGELSINVYPNPTQDNIRINLNSEEKGTVSLRLINLIGNLIQADQYDKQANLWSANMSLGGLASGVYLLEVQLGKLKEIRKVVKIGE